MKSNFPFAIYATDERTAITALQFLMRHTQPNGLAFVPDVQIGTQRTHVNSQPVTRSASIQVLESEEMFCASASDVYLNFTAHRLGFRRGLVGAVK
jgi:hypothetical protein